MKKEVLIIGRGLAGSILSLKLIDRGIKHDIIDEPNLSLSSKIAGGLINPIVLKRLKLVADVEDYYIEIPKAYNKWQVDSEFKFIESLNIAHILQSAGEQNDWTSYENKELFNNFLNPIEENLYEYIKAPLGFGIMQNVFRLNTREFLDFHKRRFSNFGELVEEKVKPDELDKYRSEYKKVIICNGHLMTELIPEFENLFSRSRGEVIEIKASGLPSDRIIHGPVFTLPLGDNKFKVGATFQWDYFEDKPSEEGLEKLKEGLEKIYSGEYTVLNHYAGVRPNTFDRKPLLGKMDEGLYSFNGMGSRAALFAPYLANVLIDNLTQGSVIPEKYDVNRRKKKGV